MDQIKAFYDKNKKIVIPAAIILILLIAAGIYFVSQPHVDTNKKAENQTEEKADISKDDKKEEDKNRDSEDKKADKEDTADHSDTNADSSEPASKPSGNGGDNSSSTGNSKPADKPASKPSRPTKPAHTHSWKNHTATKRVWVPNIVEVPVYETKKVHGAQFYTFSGYNELGQETWIANGPIYWFENGFTHDDLEEIIYNALLQSPNGVVDGVLYAHYANIQRYDKVQTGTTKEDQGSYKTENYVDFQYCDCGTIKLP